jgi:hypothetical protein
MNIDPTGFITEAEGNEADSIISILSSTYGVFIDKDWGYTGTPTSTPTVSVTTTPTPTVTITPTTSCKWLPGEWKNIWDLRNVQAAIERTSIAVGGGANFSKMFGEFRIAFRAVSCGKGCTYPGIGGNYLIVLEDQGKPGNISLDVLDTHGDYNFDEWTVVHEMGHLWDFRNNENWRKKLLSKTGGYVDYLWRQLKTKCSNDWEPGCNDASYFYGDVPAKGSDSNFNPGEDFAESFAAYIFPTDATNYVKTYYSNIPSLYYADYTKTLRYFFIDSLVNGKIP